MAKADCHQPDMSLHIRHPHNLQGPSSNTNTAWEHCRSSTMYDRAIAAYNDKLVTDL